VEPGGLGLAHEHDFIDVLRRHAGRAHGVGDGIDGALDEILDQAFELAPRGSSRGSTSCGS
jgi:hypothetical protein